MGDADWSSGEQLEAALEKLNQWGRIVACGMVSVTAGHGACVQGLLTGI